jgi:hypothetical protein
MKGHVAHTLACRTEGQAAPVIFIAGYADITEQNREARKGSRKNEALFDQHAHARIITPGDAAP